jgi:hypothetical protein
MLGRITREAERLTINGSGIQGVQSLTASYNSVARPVSNLGINSIQYYPEGPQQATLEVNTLLTNFLPIPDEFSEYTSRDPMQNYTGTLPFSGIVDHGSKKFYFTEGYLETYSATCAVGQIPQSSTSSVIYGNFGTDAQFNSWEQTSETPTSLNVTSYGSMEINLDTFATNRVNSFNVNIATPRLPIYAIGNDEPTGVIAGTPIEVNVNFEIEPDDYEIKNMRLIPDETVFKNTVITLKKNNSHDILLRYSFDDMLLTSESFSANNDSNARINFNLRSFILR